MEIFGIDIGGTKCSVVKSDLNGNICSKKSFQTTSCDETIRKILSIIADFKPDKQSIFGVSCGGPLDTDAGVVLSPPNLPGWDNVEIVEILENKFGCKTFLMNDANAGALAEWKFGAGKGCDNLIFLTCGTGMGSGVILGGKLYEGTNGAAGEVGHVRLAEDGPIGFGKAGSFEGFCSGTGIAKLARQRARELDGKASYVKGDIDSVTTRDVAEAARQGDFVARDVFEISGQYLGKALSILIDILNPQAIIIGSVYARCQDLLEPSMRKELANECLKESLCSCQVLPASLGEKIGDYAAISVALYNVESSHCMLNLR